MTDRTTRHSELAAAGIKEHQDMIAAHLAGLKPPIVRSYETGKPAIFFTPQSGEKIVKGGISWGGTEHALKELQMYWRRIPDFGVHEARIFASEEGWVQVLYWSGAAPDGTLFRGAGSRRHHDGSRLRYHPHGDPFGQSAMDGDCHLPAWRRNAVAELQ